MGLKESPSPIGEEQFPNQLPSLGGAQWHGQPIMELLRAADAKKKEKEEMSGWGQFFSLLNSGDGSGAPQATQAQAPGMAQVPGQQRRPRQQLPNAGAQMIESLLGMSMGG